MRRWKVRGWNLTQKEVRKKRRTRGHRTLIRVLLLHLLRRHPLFRLLCETHKEKVQRFPMNPCFTLVLWCKLQVQSHQALSPPSFCRWLCLRGLCHRKTLLGRLQCCQSDWYHTDTGGTFVFRRRPEYLKGNLCLKHPLCQTHGGWNRNFLILQAELTLTFDVGVLPFCWSWYPLFFNCYCF